MSKINKVIGGVALFLIIALMSCNSGPQPIRIGQDACSFCKMSIADKNFGAEIITKKGKVYKFDDTHCVFGFMKSPTVDRKDIKEIYLVNFDEPHNFIVAQKAFLLKSAELHSPMGGNVAAWEDENKMQENIKKLQGENTITTWDALAKENQ